MLKVHNWLELQDFGLALWFYFDGRDRSNKTNKGLLVKLVNYFPNQTAYNSAL